MRISYICIVLCFYFSVVFTSELQTNLINIDFFDNDGQVHTLKIKQQDIQKLGTLSDIPKNLMSDTSEPLKIPIKDLSSSNLEMIQEIFNDLNDVDTLRVLRKTSDNDLGIMLTIADYLDIPIIYNNSLKIMIERILADKEKYKSIDQNDYFGINDNHNIKNSIKKELIKNIHPTFKNLHTLKGHTDFVSSVTLSNDGHFLIFGNWRGTIKIWDIANQQCTDTLLGHAHAVISVALSNDGRFLVSGSYDQTIKIWDMASKQCIGTLFGHTEVISVAWSNDSRLIVSSYRNGTIKIWDVASQQCIGTLLGHTNRVCSAIFSNDDRFIVSGSWDKTIKIWDVVSQQCVGTLLGHTGFIISVALSNDGHFLVSGSYDKTIKIWDMASQQCIGTLLGHTSFISAVILSHNGCFIVSSDLDGTIKIWDVASQQCVGTLLGHKEAIHSVALSRDGRFLASGDWDGIIKIWDKIAYDTNNTIAEILHMQEKMRWKQLISMFSGIGAGISLSYLFYKYLQK